MTNDDKAFKDSFSKYIEELNMRKAKSKKIPLGVLPEQIWKKRRLEDLSEAIKQYEESGFYPMPEWIDELKRLECELGK